jgi:prepilin-type N-terminal cleavage/methylation domain-containing protein
MRHLPSARGRVAGYSLVEMLIVISIMGVLATLAVVSFSSTNDAQSFASQVSDFQQIFNDARAYAMANNTVVYVGMEEVDASQPIGAVPQNLMTASVGGRIAVGVASSTSGTTPTASGNISSSLTAINKLRIFSNMHMEPTYYQGPSGVPASSPSPLANRAAIANKQSSICYNDTLATASYQYFSWPLTGTAQYTFNRIIQFSPDGSAILLNTTSTNTKPPCWTELDLEEMHGSSVTSSAVYTYTNLSKAKTGHEVAAIQIDGVTGNTQLYQQ